MPPIPTEMFGGVGEFCTAVAYFSNASLMPPIAF